MIGESNLQFGERTLEVYDVDDDGSSIQGSAAAVRAGSRTRMANKSKNDEGGFTHLFLKTRFDR